MAQLEGRDWSNMGHPGGDVAGGGWLVRVGCCRSSPPGARLFLVIGYPDNLKSGIFAGFFGWNIFNLRDDVARLYWSNRVGEQEGKVWWRPAGGFVDLWLLILHRRPRPLHLLG